jgi:hypothetical protein
MSIQSIINSAQTIEVSRPALVASSMSRSGRLFTGTRNWTKPWRFIVSPKPIWRIGDVRSVIEAIMTADKHTEQQVSLGLGGANWITSYQGSVTISAGALVGVTCASATGTNIVINYTGLSNGLVILKPGDIIQPSGHRYPYVVTNTVTATGATGTATINLHRGFIPQTSYSVNGANLLVGSACIWRVKVSSLPTYRYVSGQLVEFTDDFELIESII